MEKIDKLLKHPLYKECQQKIDMAELDRIFCKHGIEHALDVARIFYIKVLEKNMPYQKEIVYAAALLHDLGRSRQYEEGVLHHEAGTEIALKILEECDYEKDEIIMITKAIQSHRISNENQDFFSRMLYEADKESRNCYSCKARKECYWTEERKNKTIIY